MIVLDFKADSGRGDSFNLLLESATPLEEITKKVADEYAQCYGRVVHLATIDKVHEDYYRGEEGALKVLENKAHSAMRDILIRPVLHTRQERMNAGKTPSDAYNIHEINLPRGDLKRFYDFLDKKYG